MGWKPPSKIRKETTRKGCAGVGRESIAPVRPERKENLPPLPQQSLMGGRLGKAQDSKLRGCPQTGEQWPAVESVAAEAIKT